MITTPLLQRKSTTVLYSYFGYFTIRYFIRPTTNSAPPPHQYPFPSQRNILELQRQNPLHTVRSRHLAENCVNSTPSGETVVADELLLSCASSCSQVRPCTLLLLFILPPTTGNTIICRQWTAVPVLCRCSSERVSASGERPRARAYLVAIAAGLLSEHRRCYSTAQTGILLFFYRHRFFLT